MIPVFDSEAEFATRATELEEAALRVLRSGRYILGEEVAELEQELAEFVGVESAVTCGSGTDALWLGLRALGVGAGDAVAAPAFTFFATISAILATGATPVLCDIEPETFSLDPECLVEAIGGRRRVTPIRVVIPVHLFGQAADMDGIRAVALDHGLRVLEDAAQAFGAIHGCTRVGALGDAAAHSFFPTKNLGGFGDGGAVTTRDAQVADRIRALRAHGSRQRYSHEVAGTNSRLDALQAAMLRVRLRHIDTTLEQRRAVANAYDEALEGSPVVRPVRTGGRAHTFNLYVVRIPRARDHVAKRLAAEGIGTAVHYPGPVHLQPAVAHLGYQRGDFPVAEQACSEVLSLPTYPSLGPERARNIGRALARITSEV